MTKEFTGTSDKMMFHVKQMENKGCENIEVEEKKEKQMTLWE